MTKKLVGAVIAGRLRMLADKIENYTNAFGQKIGWDGGLHAFLKMLDKVEIVLDANIQKAKLKALKIASRKID